MLGQPRILIVDDEPDVVELVQEILGAYDVHAVTSYQAACSRLADEDWDLVILDIMGVRGLHLLGLYGGRFDCIMLTSRGLSTVNFEEALGGGARLFLPKTEIANLDLYVDRALRESRPLWKWLTQQLDFAQWFGPGWSLEGARDRAVLLRSRDTPQNIGAIGNPELGLVDSPRAFVRRRRDD